MNPLRKFKENKKVINLTIIKCTAYTSILIFLYMNIELVGSYQLPGLAVYICLLSILLYNHLSINHLFISYLQPIIFLYMYLSSIYLLSPSIIIYLPAYLSSLCHLSTNIFSSIYLSFHLLWGICTLYENILLCLVY